MTLTTTTVELAGHTCVLVHDDSPMVRDADGARDLIGAAMSEQARVVVVPVSRLDATFFALQSGLAGEIFQKMVNYHLKLAIVGDISAHVAASKSFHDLVVECNRGHDVYFCANMDDLATRLAAIPA